MFSRKSSGVGASVALTNSYNPTNGGYLLGSVNGTPTNAGAWTLSLWIKRTRLGIAQVVTANTTGPFEGLYFDATDTLYFYLNGAIVLTGPVLRDTASWTNITVLVTGFGGATMYINNSLVATSGPFDPLVYSYYYNAAGYTKIFGNYTGGASQFYGSIAGVYFLDGTIYNSANFGSTNANTGTFQPGGSGTLGISGAVYGNNGFNLLFLSNSIGTNLASSGNQFTETGIHLTPSYDVPTKQNNQANYSVFNALQTSGILSQGGTTLENGFALSTMAMTSGKWYWEFKFSGVSTLGISDGTTGYDISPTGSFTTYGFKLDLTAGTFEYTTNGTTYTSIATGLVASQYFVRAQSYSAGNTIVYNSGITNFVYPAPSGFERLNSYNLPNGGIIIGGYNNTTLNYAGNGSVSRNLTYAFPFTGFRPDLLFVKKSSTGNQDWIVMDSLRIGPNWNLFLNSRSPGASGSSTVSAFNANGFTVGSSALTNQNGSNYASYGWKANGSTYTQPTQGTLYSESSTNTTNGFSVVYYIGNGVSGSTVGHGLGVVPQFIIAKQWQGTFFRGWTVYHKDVGNTTALFVDSTGGGTSSSGYWNNTTPASTVFTVGNDADVNELSQKYMAYCWTPIVGYSKFDKWTGTGNATTGAFVYTGFQPAFIMYKGRNIDNWVIVDDSYLEENTGTIVAGQTNPSRRSLNPNLDTGYQTSPKVDILSNGFRIRTADADTNATGITYVYAAFAKSPLSVSNAV
jgi:hypothetical protein